MQQLSKLLNFTKYLAVAALVIIVALGLFGVSSAPMKSVKFFISGIIFLTTIDAMITGEISVKTNTLKKTDNSFPFWAAVLFMFLAGSIILFV